MRLYRNEEARSAEIAAQLTPEFKLAERIHRFWLETPKDEWIWNSGLADKTIHLSMLLSIQMLRQYRSVIEQCRRGEGFCGNMVSRGLFETTLALLFILRGTVRLETKPVMDHSGKQQKRKGKLLFAARRIPKKNIVGRKQCLSRTFRADLYLAHSLFSEERLADKCSRGPGMKRFAATLDRRIDKQIVAAFEKEIGAEWTSALREKNSFSGLTVSDLTELLDPRMTKWYATIYGVQSGMIHGAAAMRHAEVDEDSGMGGPAYVSSVKDVSGALQTATALVLRSLAAFQKYIGFGNGTGMIISGLYRQFHEVYPADDD